MRAAPCSLWRENGALKKPVPTALTKAVADGVTPFLRLLQLHVVVLVSGADPLGCSTPASVDRCDLLAINRRKPNAKQKGKIFLKAQS